MTDHFLVRRPFLQPLFFLCPLSFALCTSMARERVEAGQLGFDVAAAGVGGNVEQTVTGEVSEKTAAADPVILRVFSRGQIHKLDAAT